MGAGRTDDYAYVDPRNTQAVTGITGEGYARELSYDDDGWVARDVTTSSARDDSPATTLERALSFDASGCMREAIVREAVADRAEQTTTVRNLCGLGAQRAYRETTFPDALLEKHNVYPLHICGRCECIPLRRL